MKTNKPATRLLQAIGLLRRGEKMPYRKDIQIGLYYHIYNRGVNKSQIFFNADNFTYFLRLMKKNLSRYSLSIAAYSLLPNHYHLLIRIGQVANLSNFMKSLSGSYSQALNKQRTRVGPLFQGRYKSIFIDKDEYLVQLSRYIHLNPVLAGLVKSPEDWSYSNYSDVIGLRNGTLRDDTLVPERFESGKDYQEFVEGYQSVRNTEKEFEKYLLD